jgi:hypothetical protein
LRARANSASSHGYVQNESHAVFFSLENERNAFSRLMGTELIAIDQLFQTVCPEPALAN